MVLNWVQDGKLDCSCQAIPGSDLYIYMINICTAGPHWNLARLPESPVAPVARCPLCPVGPVRLIFVNIIVLVFFLAFNWLDWRALVYVYRSKGIYYTWFSSVVRALLFSLFFCKRSLDLHDAGSMISCVVCRLDSQWVLIHISSGLNWNWLDWPAT